MNDGTDDDAPLSELAAEVRDRRRDGDEDGDDPLEAFTEREYEEVDTEELWAELENGDGGADVVESDPSGTGTDRETDGVTHVVPKDTFCENCQHLSAPPEVACTYEGSEILEFVDMEHVRVRGCPIVAERRGMEASDDVIGSL